MLKLMAIALATLCITACITVEIPAPEYPELPEVGDSVSKSDNPKSGKTNSKSTVSVEGRSTPRPADTALPAAAHSAKRRPDSSQIVVISNSRLDSREMMNAFENNVHLAEKAFDNKWIWFVEESVERVERNRLRLYTGSDDRVLYARFPSGAGLEDVIGQVEILCFDPTFSERNDVLTLTVSDCEIIENPLEPDF